MVEVLKLWDMTGQKDDVINDLYQYRIQKGDIIIVKVPPLTNERDRAKIGRVVHDVVKCGVLVLGKDLYLEVMKNESAESLRDTGGETINPTVCPGIVPEESVFEPIEPAISPGQLGEYKLDPKTHEFVWQPIGEEVQQFLKSLGSDTNSNSKAWDITPEVRKLFMLD